MYKNECIVISFSKFIYIYIDNNIIISKDQDSNNKKQSIDIRAF